MLWPSFQPADTGSLGPATSVLEIWADSHLKDSDDICIEAAFSRYFLFSVLYLKIPD